MRLILAVALSALVVAAIAQSYPTKPVRLIIPAAPGGNPDVLARMLAQKFSESFGRSFIAENAPGAGGVVAAEVVAKSAPDGHVLMLSDSGALAINVALNPKLPYQPLRDFTFITALVTVPTVLVVNTNTPSLREFIELAKSKPGALSYGSAGTGSIHHLTMAVFASRAGIEVLHVPYKGGTAMVSALLGGEIQAGWSGIPNVLQAIRAGRLRALCMSTARRQASLPDVPTAAELGFDGFDIATMIGLIAPAGTPREIVVRLQGAAAKALRERDVAERMANLGMEMVENGTEHFERLVRADIQRYAEAVRTAGVRHE
jgi:tripartite-type tricarboxylate transporter receptor subunit TctC